MLGIEEVSKSVKIPKDRQLRSIFWHNNNVIHGINEEIPGSNSSGGMNRPVNGGSSHGAVDSESSGRAMISVVSDAATGSVGVYSGATFNRAPFKGAMNLPTSSVDGLDIQLYDRRWEGSAYDRPWKCSQLHADLTDQRHGIPTRSCVRDEKDRGLYGKHGRVCDGTINSPLSGIALPMPSREFLMEARMTPRDDGKARFYRENSPRRRAPYPQVNSSTEIRALRLSDAMALQSRCIVDNPFQSNPENVGDSVDVERLLRQERSLFAMARTQVPSVPSLESDEESTKSSNDGHSAKSSSDGERLKFDNRNNGAKDVEVAVAKINGTSRGVKEDPYYGSCKVDEPCVVERSCPKDGQCGVERSCPKDGPCVVEGSSLVDATDTKHGPCTTEHGIMVTNGSEERGKAPVEDHRNLEQVCGGHHSKTLPVQSDPQVQQSTQLSASPAAGFSGLNDSMSGAFQLLDSEGMLPEWGWNAALQLPESADTNVKGMEHVDVVGHPSGEGLVGVRLGGYEPFVEDERDQSNVYFSVCDPSMRRFFSNRTSNLISEQHNHYELHCDRVHDSNANGEEDTYSGSGKSSTTEVALDNGDRNTWYTRDSRSTLRDLNGVNHFRVNIPRTESQFQSPMLGHRTTMRTESLFQSPVAGHRTPRSGSLFQSDPKAAGHPYDDHSSRSESEFPTPLMPIRTSRPFAEVNHTSGSEIGHLPEEDHVPRSDSEAAAGDDHDLDAENVRSDSKGISHVVWEGSEVSPEASGPLPAADEPLPEAHDLRSENEFPVRGEVSAASALHSAREFVASSEFRAASEFLSPRSEFPSQSSSEGLLHGDCVFGMNLQRNNAAVPNLIPLRLVGFLDANLDSVRTQNQSVTTSTHRSSAASMTALAEIPGVHEVVLAEETSIGDGTLVLDGTVVAHEVFVADTEAGLTEAAPSPELDDSSAVSSAGAPGGSRAAAEGTTDVNASIGFMDTANIEAMMQKVEPIQLEPPTISMSLSDWTADFLTRTLVPEDIFQSNKEGGMPSKRLVSKESKIPDLMRDFSFFTDPPSDGDHLQTSNNSTSNSANTDRSNAHRMEGARSNPVIVAEEHEFAASPHSSCIGRPKHPRRANRTNAGRSPNQAGGSSNQAGGSPNRAGGSANQVGGSPKQAEGSPNQVEGSRDQAGSPNQVSTQAPMQNAVTGPTHNRKSVVMPDENISVPDSTVSQANRPSSLSTVHELSSTQDSLIESTPTQKPSSKPGSKPGSQKNSARSVRSNNPQDSCKDAANCTASALEESTETEPPHSSRPVKMKLQVQKSKKLSSPLNFETMQDETSNQMRDETPTHYVVRQMPQPVSQVPQTVSQMPQPVDQVPQTVGQAPQAGEVLEPEQIPRADTDRANAALQGSNANAACQDSDANADRQYSDGRNPNRNLEDSNPVGNGPADVNANNRCDPLGPNLADTDPLRRTTMLRHSVFEKVARAKSQLQELPVFTGQLTTPKPDVSTGHLRLRTSAQLFDAKLPELKPLANIPLGINVEEQAFGVKREEVDANYRKSMRQDAFHTLATNRWAPETTLIQAPEPVKIPKGLQRPSLLTEHIFNRILPANMFNHLKAPETHVDDDRATSQGSASTWEPDSGRKQEDEQDSGRQQLGGSGRQQLDRSGAVGATPRGSLSGAVTSSGDFEVLNYSMNMNSYNRQLSNRSGTMINYSMNMVKEGIKRAFSKGDNVSASDMKIATKNSGLTLKSSQSRAGQDVAGDMAGDMFPMRESMAMQKMETGMSRVSTGGTNSSAGKGSISRISGNVSGVNTGGSMSMQRDSLSGSRNSRVISAKTSNPVAILGKPKKIQESSGPLLDVSQFDFHIGNSFIRIYNLEDTKPNDPISEVTDSE